MMRLHKILLTLVCFTVLSAHAQWKWLNPLECGFPVIQNQGWTEEIGATIRFMSFFLHLSVYS